MKLLRSNLLFFLTMVVLTSAAVCGGLMARHSHRSAIVAQRKLRAWQRELESLRALTPPPTAQTFDLMTQDLADARSRIASLRGRLMGTGSAATQLRNFSVPPAGAEAYFELASYTGRMREEAKKCGVGLMQDEYFGFADYAKTGPSTAEVASVFQDRAITEYLLHSLFSAQPKRLVSIGRSSGGSKNEALSSKDMADRARSGASNSPELHSNRPSPAADDLVDVTSYRIVFEGDTTSLRSFLNRMKTDDVPIVVRSLEVEPASLGSAEWPPHLTGKGTEPLGERAFSQYSLILDYLKLTGDSAVSGDI